jgi:glucans biosynthesis protein
MVPMTAQVTSAAAPFSFAEVRHRAAVLARRPYADNKSPLPPAVRNLTYDQYRQIGFCQDKALWREEALPFEVHLFHYPPHQDEQHEIVFLGASYFRVKGPNQHYGLSARGLAIDTGLSQKEEFPRFREFWLEKPNRDATALTLYILMDSPSATGAYHFTIRPGTDTVLEVKAHVFMRQDVEKIGFAPLTSMFFSGEGTNRFLDDFRPEVHDSDGLLMATGDGEWIWRPLANPTRWRVSSFHGTNPRGFGLAAGSEL